MDWDERYLAQARFAAEVSGFAGSVEFRKLSVYDVAALGEQFDLVVFMGVLYHLRHPLLALDLIHEHAVRPDGLMLFQSMQRGSTEIERPPEDPPFQSTEMFDRPGYPKLHFIEQVQRRHHQLVGPQPGLRRGHAAGRRLPHRGPPGAGSLPLQKDRTDRRHRRAAPARSRNYPCREGDARTHSKP